MYPLFSNPGLRIFLSSLNLEENYKCYKSSNISDINEGQDRRPEKRGFRTIPGGSPRRKLRVHKLVETNQGLLGHHMEGLPDGQATRRTGYQTDRLPDF